jgi:SM-20-related protein
MLSAPHLNPLAVGSTICDTLSTTLCENLVQHGWSQHDLFLSAELSDTLAAECLVLQQSDVLQLARVGSGKHATLQNTIRSDQIAWLRVGQSTACDAYLLMMEQVRVLLNQTLYLGLEDYESHFSFYAPGAFYRKHLDRFQHDDARTISIVIYLNDQWRTAQGGALRLHPHELPPHDISPIACRMVVFLSAEMLHEVLPATRDRMSLTGWFRRRVAA